MKTKRKKQKKTANGAKRTRKATKRKRPSGARKNQNPLSPAWPTSRRLPASTETLSSTAGEYYGIVIEIPSIEFRFLTESRQDSIIDRSLGSVLRTVTGDGAAALVKIDRPVIYDDFIRSENRKLEEIKEAYRNGLLADEELTCRVGIIHDRIEEIRRINVHDKVYRPFHYLVFFEKERNILQEQANNAGQTLAGGDLACHILSEKELAVFLKYQYTLQFDEREVYIWSAAITCSGFCHRKLFSPRAPFVTPT
jgi:hypothetical protein